MPEFELILTLAGGLGAALAAGYVTQRLGLSPIVGYLLAGVAIGPYSPGFTANQELAEQFAEVGVILLLFGVGLQFKPSELLAVRRIALPGAFTASAIMATGVALAARLAGWSWSASIVFGLAPSVASTVVLVRLLTDNRELHTAAGHLAVGWLVVEDLFTVILLVLLPTIFIEEPTPARLAGNVGFTVLKVAGLIAFALVAGRRAIPAILDRVAATRSRELFTLTILTLALGIAVGSATIFGVSMPLGAFLAGLVVGQSEYSLRAATEALPMRDAFAVLFFVSVGMLLDPSAVLEQPLLTAVVLTAVIVGKPALIMVMLLVARLPLRTILPVALSIGHIGEFSFIVTVLARDLGVVPPDAMNIIVAVSIASITVSPLVSRLADPVERRLLRIPALRWAATPASPGAPGAASSLNPRDRAVVVGYGPTGRTVTRLLMENGISPTVIELNMDSVRALHRAGVSAVYGDARHSDTLVTAGVRFAATLIVSGADPGAPQTIREARDLNPKVHVIARGGYLRDVPELHAAGASQVFSGEGEVALAMTEAVLRRLGATPEQIDRERERLHEELFGVRQERQDTA